MNLATATDAQTNRPSIDDAVSLVRLVHRSISSFSIRGSSRPGGFASLEPAQLESVERGTLNWTSFGAVHRHKMGHPLLAPTAFHADVVFGLAGFRRIVRRACSLLGAALFARVRLLSLHSRVGVPKSGRCQYRDCEDAHDEPPSTCDGGRACPRARPLFILTISLLNFSSLPNTKSSHSRSYRSHRADRELTSEHRRLPRNA